MPLVARKRAVVGVAAWTSVLRELLLAYAADDPGFREGGGRGGGDRGGGVLGDHHDPLHRRRVVTAPALLVRRPSGVRGRFGPIPSRRGGVRRRAFSKLKPEETLEAGRRG